MSKTITKLLFIYGKYELILTQASETPTKHNLVVSLINSLYFADPIKLSKILDWTSDPTDDY